MCNPVCKREGAVSLAARGLPGSHTYKAHRKEEGSIGVLRKVRRGNDFALSQRIYNACSIWAAVMG